VKKSHFERGVRASKQRDCVTKDYVLIARFRNFLSFQRAMSDGYHRNRVREISEEG
jgi:hypothetical protein